jgi:hypothetical protein
LGSALSVLLLPRLAPFFIIKIGGWHVHQSPAIWRLREDAKVILHVCVGGVFTGASPSENECTHVQVVRRFSCSQPLAEVVVRSAAVSDVVSACQRKQAHRWAKQESITLFSSLDTGVQIQGETVAMSMKGVHCR